MAVGVALFLYGLDVSIFPVSKSDDAFTLIESSLPVMFDDRHWAMIVECVSESYTWFAMIGCVTAVLSRSIWRGVWFETPKARTFPLDSTSK